MSKLRRIFTSALMVMVVLSMGAFASVENTSASAQAGDLIKMDGLSAVYFLGADGKRYVFPDQSSYFSWYSDFSGVITVSATELQSYPLGYNVSIRPGTRLVKITTDPKVYAVEPGGHLRWIQSEADALALYGADWAKMVVDVNDSFFINSYTIIEPLASGEYPAGQLLKNADGSSIYYWDGAEYRKFTSEAAFVANGFNFNHVIEVEDMTWSPLGADITAHEHDFMIDGTVDTTTPSTGSGLSVALSANTPVSKNIPEGVEVEFLKFNLTAAADGAVNVSSIDLTAYGLSTATYIQDITFYVGGSKVGTSRNMGSDRVRTFNFPTPINVAAGQTKSITVKATVQSDSGTYGLGIAGASHISAGSATVSGSFPIVSNLMSAVSGGSIGTLIIGDVNSNSSATANFGDDNVLLADFSLAIATEDALVETIRLYNGGTNVSNITHNLKLFFDGEEVADAEYVDRYVTFNLNNHLIEKGNTVFVEVKGDIGVTNVGNTIELYFRDRNDVVAVGKTHGFNLVNTLTALDAASKGIKVTLGAGDFTINMDKTVVPAKDVKPGDKKVKLANLELRSNSENATLREVIFTIAVTPSSGSATTTNNLENFEMVNLSTGGIYDLAINTAGTKVSTDEEIFLPVGEIVSFDIRADIHDDAAEDTTFKVSIAADAKDNLDIEGDVSGVKIVNITPNTVDGSFITVKKASLDHTTTHLTDLSVVGGATDVVLYQGKLKAGSADDIRLQSVKFTSSSSTPFSNNDISQLRLYLDGNLIRTVSNAISTDTINFTSLIGDKVIDAGMEVNLVVKGNFVSTLSNPGLFNLKIATSTDLVSRSVTGNDVVNATIDATASRNITTVANGDLMIEMLTSASNVNRDSYVLAGTVSERYIGEIKFTTKNEDIKVSKLILTNQATSTNSDLNRIELVNADGIVIAHTSVSVNGSATFDPFNIVFEADKSTSLFIRTVAKGINVSGDPTSTATDGKTAQYKITSVNASGVNSGATLTMESDSTAAWGKFTNANSKTNTIVGSKLNTVVNDLVGGTGTLTGGAGVLAKYKFTFNNGSNRTDDNQELKAILNEFKVNFNMDTATVTEIKLHIDGQDDTKIAATSTATVTGTGGDIYWDRAALVGLVDEAKVNGEVVLVITGTVSGLGDNSYIQTRLTNLSDGTSFKYWSNGEASGTPLANMLLPYTEVLGATLNR